MIEWKDPYNSFNSFKGFTYINQYQAIDDWRLGKRKSPLPPIEVSLDPIHACNLGCSHCFNGEELISLYNFDSKKIKDIKIGDKVLGFKKGKISPVKVLKVYKNGFTDKMIRFTFEDGDTFECTSEHRIWETRGRWKKAEYFKVGNYVKKGFRFNRFKPDIKKYMEGYISGMALGDGCFWLSQNRNGNKSGRFRLALNDIEATEIFGKYCSDLDIKWHWGRHQFKVHKDYRKNNAYIEQKALWITDDINAKKIRNLMDTDENNTSFKIGWISGLFDAEGSGGDVIRISQFPSTTKTRLMIYLMDLDYKFVEEEKGIRLIGRAYDQLNFFLDIDNKILRKRNNVLQRKVCSKKKIIKIEQLTGNYEKYDLETETHNYLVKGVLVHNCNASRYLEDKNNPLRRFSDDHMMNLIKFLAKWGVKGICFGGGGEPSLHTKLADAIFLARELGVETSVATNGLILTPALLKAYAQCRWVGVSVDAANKETYMIGRKLDGFEKVIHNIDRLVEYIHFTHNKCDVAFKFLIFDYNQREIFDACKIAKSLGVKDFHARPADFRHQGMTAQQQNNFYDINNIEEQFIACHNLEDEQFRVFTVVHKFNQDFTPRRKFTQCYASPICIQLCANGNIYLCPDQRHVDFYKLGTHYPNPKNILKLWGSKLHYDLVFKRGCSACTSRCTFSPYNEQCERLAINKDDPMCTAFV